MIQTNQMVFEKELRRILEEQIETFRDHLESPINLDGIRETQGKISALRFVLNEAIPEAHTKTDKANR